jgi:hypothetical protein
MRASDISIVAGELIAQRLPLFIWGSPGIGKSSIIKEIAKESRLEFIDLRLSLLDPTDLKGIPFFDTSTKEGLWAKPSFLPKEDDKSKGILFLDEINTAPPAVQASAYQLILDRRVGEYILPDGWSIVAAGNRESDRGVVYKMPPPLANRFVHFEMEVDFSDWKRWAYRVGIESSIIAFLEYDKSRLFTFDPKEMQKSFSTPRSWEFVDTIVRGSIPSDLILETISGAVGRDSAVGYISFKNIIDKLPNLHSILDGTITELESYDDHKVMIALSIGLVNLLRDTTDMEQIDRVLAFSLNIPSEYAIMLVRDMQHNSIDIENSLNWDRWVEKFSYLLV